LRILITGSTGFIGEYLTKELASQEHEIFCLVRSTSKIDKIKDLNISIIYGDILNRKSLETAVEDVDIIYHLVGVGSLSANSEEEFNKFYNINFTGTQNLLESVMAKNVNVKKIICISSTAAVGLRDGIINESTTCTPKTPYQKSKYEGEKMILDYYETQGLPVTIIRPCMVYGEGDLRSEILKMCKFIKMGFFPLFNDGNNAVPLIYITDLIQGILLSAEKGRDGEIYFITNEKISTMNEIIDAISNNMNSRVSRLRIPKRIAKICAYIIEEIALIFKIRPIITRDRIDSMTASRIFSIDKAKTDLDYSPRVSLEEGIANTIMWYKNNNII
jgi:nucleoside-diphosphate-sugar epimerase